MDFCIYKIYFFKLCLIMSSFKVGPKETLSLNDNEFTALGVTKFGDRARIREQCRKIVAGKVKKKYSYLSWNFCLDCNQSCNAVAEAVVVRPSVKCVFLETVNAAVHHVFRKGLPLLDCVT